jgi:hypothetical protein
MTLAMLANLALKRPDKQPKTRDFGLEQGAAVDSAAANHEEAAAVADNDGCGRGQVATRLRDLAAAREIGDRRPELVGAGHPNILPSEIRERTVKRMALVTVRRRA